MNIKVCPRFFDDVMSLICSRTACMYVCLSPLAKAGSLAVEKARRTRDKDMNEDLSQALEDELIL